MRRKRRQVKDDEEDENAQKGRKCSITFGIICLDSRKEEVGDYSQDYQLSHFHQMIQPFQCGPWTLLNIPSEHPTQFNNTKNSFLLALLQRYQDISCSTTLQAKGSKADLGMSRNYW